MLDQPDEIRRKIRKAVVSPRVVEDNGLLALVQYILLPAAGLKGKREFGICKQGSEEPFMYTDIEAINEDYKNDVVSTGLSRSAPRDPGANNVVQITPQALKAAVGEALVELTASIREKYDASTEWQDIKKKAYPTAEPAVKKLTKKVKNVKIAKGEME